MIATAIKYWYFIAIALLIGVILWMRGDLADDKVTIANQKTQITALVDANTDFKALADKSTAAAAQAKADAAQQKMRFAAALKAADASNKNHLARADAIMKQPVTGDPCTFTHTMFTSYMKGRHP